ncbi:MAG: hypothetical protein ACPL7I_05800 [Myxococcota bacterium]
MKKTLLVTLLLATLAFVFVGCSAEDATTDAGLKKDAGPKDTGPCTPSCDGKACGDDDGCGGKCVGSCPDGQTCNPNTFVCEGCTPNCNGKFCGDDDGCGGKCTACANANETCNKTTWKCESGGSCQSAEGGACNIDTNPCCEGLACVTFGKDQKDANCYKDCTNDQSVCSSTQQCIGWKEGQGACFEVTTIANGTFSNCKSYKKDEKPTNQPGTASIKFSLGGISYNFTTCLGDFEVVDSSGTYWLVQIADITKLQTKKIAYLYNIIVDPSVHTVGQQQIGEKIQPVVYELLLDSQYNTTKAMLHALGIQGDVNFTAVGTGNKTPTTGTISNVLMMGYDWVVCDNNAGNPCQ